MQMFLIAGHQFAYRTKREKMSTADAKQILQTKNYNIELKQEQIDIIDKILDKRDTIGVLPTGFGKSLCYVVPPLILDKRNPTKRHVSLVISPLKSLIQDQVADLRAHGISAFGILEGMDQEDIQAIEKGECSLLFGSPEAVMKKHWRDILESMRETICVVAYDEAHCISEWGLDFRPEYQKIGILQSILDSPVLVLSATMNTQIRADIDKILGLQPAETCIVATLPDRPNIFLNLFKATERYEDELQWVINMVKERKDHSPKVIIYTNSITMCETLYIWMHTELGEDAYNGAVSLDKRMIEMYHAHTDQDTKSRIMEQITSTDSVIRVLIATVACGMGVNIPDITYVLLWGLPPSLLQLWQEIGRCGRDGRSGLAICYAFARSISMPCDKCRKERKFQCKCTDREHLRGSVSVDQCQRVHCLKTFLLKGMNVSVLKSLENKKQCSKKCDNKCTCSLCVCCIACLKKCSCSKDLSINDIINKYVNTKSGTD